MGRVGPADTNYLHIGNIGVADRATTVGDSAGLARRLDRDCHSIGATCVHGGCECKTAIGRKKQVITSVVLQGYISRQSANVATNTVAVAQYIDSHRIRRPGEGVAPRNQPHARNRLSRPG